MTGSVWGAVLLVLCGWLLSTLTTLITASVSRRARARQAITLARTAVNRLIFILGGLIEPRKKRNVRKCLGLLTFKDVGFYQCSKELRGLVPRIEEWEAGKGEYELAHKLYVLDVALRGALAQGERALDLVKLSSDSETTKRVLDSFDKNFQRLATALIEADKAVKKRRRSLFSRAVESTKTGILPYIKRALERLSWHGRPPPR